MIDFRRLLVSLSCFALFFLIVGAIAIGYMDSLVHVALGAYGTNVDKGGYYGNGIWYVSFDVFESYVHELMIVSVLFGIIIGSLGMFGILKLWNKKMNVETK